MDKTIEELNEALGMDNLSSLDFLDKNMGNVRDNIERIYKEMRAFLKELENCKLKLETADIDKNVGKITIKSDKDVEVMSLEFDKETGIVDERSIEKNTKFDEYQKRAERDDTSKDMSERGYEKAQGRVNDATEKGAPSSKDNYVPQSATKKGAPSSEEKYYENLAREEQQFSKQEEQIISKAAEIGAKDINKELPKENQVDAKELEEAIKESCGPVTDKDGKEIDVANSKEFNKNLDGYVNELQKQIDNFVINGGSKEDAENIMQAAKNLADNARSVDAAQQGDAKLEKTIKESAKSNPEDKELAKKVEPITKAENKIDKMSKNAALNKIDKDSKNIASIVKNWMKTGRNTALQLNMNSEYNKMNRHFAVQRSLQTLAQNLSEKKRDLVNNHYDKLQEKGHKLSKLQNLIKDKAEAQFALRKEILKETKKEQTKYWDKQIKEIDKVMKQNSKARNEIGFKNPDKGINNAVLKRQKSEVEKHKADISR